MKISMSEGLGDERSIHNFEFFISLGRLLGGEEVDFGRNK